MSCGNGYLTGNMLIPFPFEDGQVLAWPDKAEEAQLLLDRCFVDAGVSVHGADIADGWPSIGKLATGASWISFVLSAGGMERPITISATDARFPIVSGKADFGSYVIVASSEGIRDFLSFCSSNSISPPVPGSSSPSERVGDFFLRLCAKCVTRSQVGLTSIKVYDGVSIGSFYTSERGYAVGSVCRRKGRFFRCISAVDVKGTWNDDEWEEVEITDIDPDFVLVNDVCVKPGNNMLLSEPDENGIQIGAVPGAGMGVIPCMCEDNAVVKSPIMSPDGHTRIFNDTCYDIEPWIETKNEGGVTERIGHIQLHAKCTACCTCAMYESIVNDRLAPLSAIVRQAKADIASQLSEYENAVKRFNQRLLRPMASDVRLSLSGMPVGANLSPKLAETKVKGKMGRCAFTAILRNSSYSVINATVYSLAGSDTVVEASASWSDADGTPRSKTGNAASDIVGQTFSIMPGMSLVVTFVSVKNEMVGAASTGGYRGSISVGLSYSTENGPSGSLGIMRKSVEV